MGFNLLNDVRDVLPVSDHDWREAGALTWLANGAGKDTGLTWQGYKALIGLVRCGKNMIGSALNRLAEKGRLSILRRPGRVPVYLIHPKGLALVAPLTAAAVRAHLSHGRFSKGETDAVLAWLAGLGVLAPADALAVLGVPAAGTPAQHRPTARLASPPEGHQRPHCGDSGVPATGNEPEYNQNRTKRAEHLPADAAKLGADLARLVAAPLPAPMASREAVRADRSLWCGTPTNVLAGLIEAGGKDADRLASMETGAALAEIARTQKLLRIPATIGRQ